MINSVVLMGRLTFEPDYKKTQSDVSVVSFQIAVDRKYGKGDERLTDFIDCAAWRYTADFVSKYFHKGDMIAIEGYIQTENFTDRDGNKRKSVKVIANNVSFCGSKSESSAKENIQSSENTNKLDFEVLEDGDDVPF